MKAKEYLRVYQKTLPYRAEIEIIVSDLYGIRHDYEATKDYYERVLQSDNRADTWKDEHLEWESLHRKYGASEKEPIFSKFEGEVEYEDAASIREQLFKVVESDKSFGYISYLLLKKQDNFPDQQNIETYIREEMLEELKMKDEYIQTLEQKYEELREIKSSKNNEDRTLKVIIEVILMLFKRLDSFSSADNTKTSKLISYLTGFSPNTIRAQLSNTEKLSASHQKEIEIVNKLLKDSNIYESISYGDK